MQIERTSERHDLIVIGGGLTGLALAAAVGGAGFRVLVIERAPLARLVSAPYDGRVTAVARGSRYFLTQIGAWDGMVATAAPINDIVVREGFSPIQVSSDLRAPLHSHGPSRGGGRASSSTFAPVSSTRRYCSLASA